MLKDLIKWQSFDPQTNDGLVSRTELGNFVYEIIEASPHEYHLMEYDISTGSSYQHETPQDATVDDLKEFLANYRMEPLL